MRVLRLRLRLLTETVVDVVVCSGLVGGGGLEVVVVVTTVALRFLLWTAFLDIPVPGALCM